jgi:hypothetical protein
MTAPRSWVTSSRDNATDKPPVRPVASAQHARDHIPGVPDHITATDPDYNTFRPTADNLHLKGAPLDRFSNTVKT